MTQELRINSFNARGLGDAKKRRCIFKWLKKLHYGITFLQETHSCTMIEDTWRREWGGHIEFSHGSCKSKGVAILFPPRLNFKINTEKRDDNGRFILLDTDIEGINIILIAVYAPTKDKQNEQLNLLQQIQTLMMDFQST